MWSALACLITQIEAMKMKSEEEPSSGPAHSNEVNSSAITSTHKCEALK
jgi:hypothetical protein